MQKLFVIKRLLLISIMYAANSVLAGNVRGAGIASENLQTLLLRTQLQAGFPAMRRPGCDGS